MTKFQFDLLSSIRNKLTASVISLTVALLISFSMVVINDQEHEIRQDNLSELKATGALVQSTINRMLRHDRAHFVTETLAELHVNPKVNFSALVDSQGTIEFAYRGQLIDTPVTDHVAGINTKLITDTIRTETGQYQYDETNRKHIAYIPITPQLKNVLEKRLNVLVIDYQSRRSWYHALSERTLAFSSILLVIIFIGIFAWSYFDRLITQRLKLIIEALAQIGHGDNVVNIAVNGNDEIATVARAMELMSQERHDNEATLLRLSTAIEQSWDSVVITNLDAQIEYVNKAFTRNTGYSKDEVIGKNPRILQSGKTPKKTYDEMWATLSQGKVWTGELCNITKDGRDYYESATITPLLDYEGNISSYLGVKKNITQEKKLQEESRKATEVLNNFFNQALNLHVIADLDGTILRVNQAWNSVLGYSPNELEGTSFLALVHPDDRQATIQEMEKISDERVSTFHFENRYRHKNGRYRLLTWSSTIDKNDDIAYAIAIDITDRAEAEKKVHSLAYFDQLTGLPNKAYLVDNLDHTLKSNTESSTYGALIVIDIDAFQRINDARGYEFGDTLLKELAQRLQQIQHEDCLLAHVSDDVFVGVTSRRFNSKGEVHRHINAMAQMILALSSRPVIGFGEDINFSLSIGATIYPGTNEDTAEVVLRQAETALHHAKKIGGNQLVTYHDAIGNEVLHAYGIEKELRHALVNNELQMYVQPQVNYQGVVLGVEALIRWHHPEKGLIMPGAFVPIAEESDIIVDLDNLMLMNALKFISHNDSKGISVTISVNVSPRHFRKLSFTPWLKEAITATGADPNHLVLEVTEGLFLDNLNEVVAKMDELRSLGIRFSIDDFGTGYSSLSYLKRLPVHELKIDRSFIKDLPEDQSDATLVKTILMVAENLGLTVVAEGVETQQQADFLASIMDVTYQGYLYGKPVSVDEWYSKNS